MAGDDQELEALAVRIRASVATFAELDAVVRQLATKDPFDMYDLSAPEAGLRDSIMALLIELRTQSALDKVDDIVRLARPLPPLAHQLLDPARFDLVDVEDAFRTGRRARTDELLVGASIVTPKAAAVLPKVRARLAEVIGADGPEEPWSLDPSFNTPDLLFAHFNRVGRRDDALVLSVQVERTVTAETLLAVWQHMVGCCPNRPEPTVVLFSFDVVVGLPPDLIVLPAPRFLPVQLELWVEAIGDALGWNRQCSSRVSAHLWADIAGDADEADPFALYDSLKFHSRELQRDPRAFHDQLCA